MRANHNGKWGSYIRKPKKRKKAVLSLYHICEAYPGNLEGVLTSDIDAEPIVLKSKDMSPRHHPYIIKTTRAGLHKAVEKQYKKIRTSKSFDANSFVATDLSENTLPNPQKDTKKRIFGSILSHKDYNAFTR